MGQIRLMGRIEGGVTTETISPFRMKYVSAPYSGRDNPYSGGVTRTQGGIAHTLGDNLYSGG